jgi:hypothetical protein
MGTKGKKGDAVRAQRPLLGDELEAELEPVVEPGRDREARVSAREDLVLQVRPEDDEAVAHRREAHARPGVGVGAVDVGGAAARWPERELAARAGLPRRV